MDFYNITFIVNEQYTICNEPKVIAELKHFWKRCQFILKSANVIQ